MDATIIRYDSHGLYKIYSFSQEDFETYDVYQEGGETENMKSIGVLLDLDKVPEEEREEIKRRVSEAIKGEFGDESVEESVNEVTGKSELDISLEEMARDEEKKIKERKKEIREVEDEKDDLMAKARKFAQEYPDSDLPSLVQCYDPVRRFDYKLALGLEKLAGQSEKEKLVVNQFSQRFDIDSEVVDEIEKLARQIPDDVLPTIIKFADEDVKNYHKYIMALEQYGEGKSPGPAAGR